MVEYHRIVYVIRLYDIVRTKDVRRTYYLYMVSASARYLGNDGRNVLEYVWSEHGLDHEDVVVALYDLHHAEIINIAVSVEVQVGDHVGGVVDGVLELGHCGCLTERSYDCLKVKVQ